MKQFLLPKKTGRFGFLVFSFISLIVFFTCTLLKDGAIMGFAILVPLYIAHAMARVRDWKGRAWLWGFTLAAVFLMVGAGIADQFKLNQQIADIDLSASVVASLNASQKGETYKPTEQGDVADILETSLLIFAIFHLWLQFKKGAEPSANYEKIRKAFSEGIHDNLTLWNLKVQKRKLGRQAEIDRLRKEVNDLKKEG